MSTKVIGKQEPRLCVLPELPDGIAWDDLYTDGQDAAEFASAYGLIPDPWQQDILNCWLTRNEKDKFCSESCGLSVPRQNGKNAILEIRELYGLCVIGEKILHTAHRVDTARKSFLRLVSFFEHPVHPELKDMVLNIRRANGQEAIQLINGGLIEFSSRINGSGRGSTYDVVVFDEAQELTDDQMESIMSTLAAAPLGNRQIIYTGTPPGPASPGTIFRRQRKAALSGQDKTIAWHEWSVEEVGDTSDVSRWYETNPALGVRLDLSFTQKEYNTLSPEGFARERLGWWSDEESANCVFTKAEWAECAVEEAPEEDEKDVIAYGIKFTLDGQNCAVSAAVKNSGKPTLVECIEYSPILNGVSYLAQWIADRKNTCAVCVIDGKAYSGALEKALLENGFPRKAIKLTNANEVCEAASMFKNAVATKEIIHTNQESLNDSVGSAQKRIVGNAGGWAFGDGIYPCAPVESVSLAYWGVKTTKRKPGRKSRIL